MPRRNAFGIACAALMSWAFQLSGISAHEIPPSVLPGIGPEANRSPVDMNAAPWRGVGVLQTEVGEHCTGALVGPRAVLTAAHCLFGPISLHLIQPNSIHFLVGYSHGEYEGHSRAATYITGQVEEILVDGRHAMSPPDADWAIVILAEPLGSSRPHPASFENHTAIGHAPGARRLRARSFAHHDRRP